jgi:hypothetical protein
MAHWQSKDDREVQPDAGNLLSSTYGLPFETVPNNSTQARIRDCQEWLYQGANEELEGALAGWLDAGAREDYQMVVWGQVEGPQADPSLRQAMWKFLNDGKL